MGEEDLDAPSDGGVDVADCTDEEVDDPKDGFDDSPDEFVVEEV